MFATNRELLLVRLCFHVFLLYVWIPAPVLCTIRLYVAYVRRVLPSSTLELQVLFQSAIIILNHWITASCTEDNTWQWMQHVVIAPNGTYAILLTFGGAADDNCMSNSWSTMESLLFSAASSVWYETRSRRKAPSCLVQV